MAASTPWPGCCPPPSPPLQRGWGLICPEAQGAEAGWAGEINVLAAPDLLSLINHFRGTQLLPAPPAG